MLEAGEFFFAARRYFISPVTLILGFEESGMKSIKSGFPQISTEINFSWHKSKNRFRSYFAHR